MPAFLAPMSCLMVEPGADGPASVHASCDMPLRQATSRPTGSAHSACIKTERRALNTAFRKVRMVPKLSCQSNALTLDSQESF